MPTGYAFPQKVRNGKLQFHDPCRFGSVVIGIKHFGRDSITNQLGYLLIPSFHQLAYNPLAVEAEPLVTLMLTPLLNVI